MVGSVLSTCARRCGANVEKLAWWQLLEKMAQNQILHENTNSIKM